MDSDLTLPHERLQNADKRDKMQKTHPKITQKCSQNPICVVPKVVKSCAQSGNTSFAIPELPQTSSPIITSSGESRTSGRLFCSTWDTWDSGGAGPAAGSTPLRALGNNGCCFKFSFLSFPNIRLRGVGGDAIGPASPRLGPESVSSLLVCSPGRSNRESFMKLSITTISSSLRC